MPNFILYQKSNNKWIYFKWQNFYYVIVDKLRKIYVPIGTDSSHPMILFNKFDFNCSHGSGPNLLKGRSKENNYEITISPPEMLDEIFQMTEEYCNMFSHKTENCDTESSDE